MPMAREALPAEPSLDAEDMGRRGLFPKGSFGMHHTRCRGRKGHALDQPVRIAGDVTQARRFARSTLRRIPA